MIAPSTTTKQISKKEKKERKKERKKEIVRTVRYVTYESDRDAVCKKGCEWVAESRRAEYIYTGLDLS
jgi:hypothetical protein